ncbi:Protein sidekick-like Protein [Tribolium castaneum]|uniref:Protein sidekick-like Protein n=1 Tax=Tribolium castaneum TaxID=7070 RepID=A0A139WC36_TRICA|nr:PREDICTED: protein sidekick isoform X3 [Tribolium castaneum]KYB25519.1 Protein sidekick-like Protein [Tribolium castaneum]|eukprot:XP_008197671.1 PREDICTED: protein sidekick isoform X3 [Tribolium castaneum]
MLVKRCTMEEKERKTRHMFLGIKTYLFIVCLASVPHDALAENSLQAPRFTTSSASSSIIRLGTTKIIQCQAFGNPSPQFRWLKDWVPITEFSTDAYYKIISASHKDEGSYRCIAANKIGSILSEEMKILVAYMKVFEDQTEKSESVVEGQAAILNLPEIESKPKPEVTWHTESGQLPYAQKYAKSKSNQLIILSTDKSDQKAYRARAINTQEGKEENSAFIRLTVQESSDHKEIAPQIIVPPEDVKIVRGTAQTTLDCIANARPLHELETLWFKDDILIENGGMYSLNDIWNRSLTLISVNTTQSGQYECRVRLRSERFDTVTAKAIVTVLEKPRFVSATRAETLGEYGTPISLPCDVVGIPKPNVTWYKNSQEVDLTDKRYVLEEDNSLRIKKLLINDSGMFQCFAKSEAGESSISTWLKVKTAGPVMELGPQNATVLDGKDATLACRAVGAPTPNITWFYKGDLIETSSRVQILDTGDLLIAAVKESDVGMYTCLRANEAGEVRGSAHLGVLVRTQIIQPPVDTRVLLGHTATLQCKISSDPAVPFDLRWYKNKQALNPKASSRISILKDGTLEIQAVRAADVGLYTCSIKSPGGNETRSAKLSVIELPYAPTNVKAERLDTASQRAVNVSWIPGFDGNSPIKQFIIQKRELPELVPPISGPIPDPLLNWVTELSNVSAEQRWILLTNLKAAAAYQFRVSAVNSVGEGSPSEPSNQVMLPQEAPSGPPVGFVGSARSSSEIITQWQPPLEEHRNGQILGYIIRYKLFGYTNSPWIVQNITNEAQRNYLIQDLITWKDYIVQIAAYNNKGVGVFTEGARIKTKEGVPEAPPIIQTVVPLNSTTIQITWKPPDPQKINGINQGYKIQAWQTDKNGDLFEAKMITVHPNLLDPNQEQTALMTGLEKFTDYNVTVLCFTDPGDGEISEFVPVKTKEDVPDEVSNLQFDDISDRAVKVIWQPPKHINGILTGYQIRYQIRDKPDTVKIKNLTADTLSLKVTDLQATTHYKFEVTAWTAMGAGPPKVAIIQSGVEPVLPHPPNKLALSNIEAFSVVLQFTPGFDGNSSITKWTVEAQTARNASWFVVFEISDPDATTITVTGLVPFTVYKLRLIANNVVGASEPSEASKEFQTIQAPPAHPPKNVTVRAMSATEVRVRWIPLQQIEWFGNPRGYSISYVEVRTGEKQTATIDDHTANSHVITGLEEFALYEVSMQACNDVGCSMDGPVALERTRESVPSFGPLNIEANATSSTTIVVKWGDVPKEHQNGLIEGYKVYYAAESKSPVQYKLIASNSTFTTTLTELRKFVVYRIQVLAYTRLGDGEPSKPAVSVRTFEDVPGPPSNVSFPDVSVTSARIIWDVPEEPNGEILAYKVTYHIDNVNVNNKYSKEFPPSDRTFRFTQLEPEKYYMFSVTAQTRLGWGKTAHALVFTTNNRDTPQSPSMPQISRSQVQSKQITFSWTPGRDGFAPLRYYTVQKMENGGPWQSLPERVDPQLTSYTVSDLKPFTSYRFRIRATNDIGPSPFSPESIEVRTYPAAPSKGVMNLKVVPITTTSVEVYWDPVEEKYWNGDVKTGGYRVVFQPVSDYPTALQATPKEEIFGINAKKMVLSELLQDKNYEIVVVPFNSQGEGPATPPVTVYVGEAVPTGEPRDLEGEAVSSTEVRLKWKPPQQQQQNGELLGYKIFYLVTNSPQDFDEGHKFEEEIEVIAATMTSHSLVFLDKYTEYRIQILAFNPAGDGPRSRPITVKTLQGLPGPPANLRFSDITMNSLLVSWDPPKKRNGDIIGYLVTYETTEENERFSKQVKQKVTSTELLLQTLEEEITYTFTVRAQTIDYGPSISDNVTTGPQDGSPTTPKELTLIKTPSSVELHWVNGLTGKGPILGYYIESRKKDDQRWQTVTKSTNGPLQEFTVSYQSLLPSTSYYFRVFPYNKFGISCPAYTKDPVVTPSKLYLEYSYLQYEPFYRQTWFMVALAATSIIIIIMIIAILCVKSKSYKYKQEGAQNSMGELMAMSRDDMTADYYRTRNGTSNLSSTLSKRSTLSRKPVHQQPPPMLGKSPPRPSPASVPYNSDEESLKGYDENPDDSSVTEKPSEMSSSESQGSESENDSVLSNSHSFVNHYANVNEPLRPSWKRQKPVRNFSSHTDSEPEGSASLNGGQIIINNMARSRAPLPGFSSFV